MHGKYIYSCTVRAIKSTSPMFSCCATPLLNCIYFLYLKTLPLRLFTFLNKKVPKVGYDAKGQYYNPINMLYYIAHVGQMNTCSTWIWHVGTMMKPMSKHNPILPNSPCATAVTPMGAVLSCNLWRGFGSWRRPQGNASVGWILCLENAFSSCVALTVLCCCLLSSSPISSQNHAGQTFLLPVTLADPAPQFGGRSSWVEWHCEETGGSSTER